MSFRNDLVSRFGTTRGNGKIFNVVSALLLCAGLCAAQSNQAPVSGLPSGASGKFSEADKVQMAERVRQEFLHAWNAYKQYAWGHDELTPLSKGHHDWYGV